MDSLRLKKEVNIPPFPRHSDFIWLFGLSLPYNTNDEDPQRRLSSAENNQNMQTC